MSKRKLGDMISDSDTDMDSSDDDFFLSATARKLMKKEEEEKKRKEMLRAAKRKKLNSEGTEEKIKLNSDKVVKTIEIDSDSEEFDYIDSSDCGDLSDSLPPVFADVKPKLAGKKSRSEKEKEKKRNEKKDTDDVINKPDNVDLVCKYIKFVFYFIAL